jgi:endoglycosylceramidase
LLIDCNKHGWFEYQFSSAAGRAYQSIYDNYKDLQTSFINYWVKIATSVANNPYVLGYELINEPWAGDVISDPLLLIPGVADRKNLAPMYDNINTAIRKVDSNHLIFFGKYD